MFFLKMPLFFAHSWWAQPPGACQIAPKDPSPVSGKVPPLLLSLIFWMSQSGRSHCHQQPKRGNRTRHNCVEDSRLLDTDESFFKLEVSIFLLSILHGCAEFIPLKNRRNFSCDPWRVDWCALSRDPINHKQWITQTLQPNLTQCKQYTHTNRTINRFEVCL